MPLYEYHCRKCGKDFEILQKMSEEPKKKCDECGGTLEKLVSQSAFHLKGTGWYKTDYASKSTTSEPKKTKTETKETTSKSKASENSTKPTKSDS